MNSFKVQTGDVFCSASPWFVGRWIVSVSAWLSADGHAKYGHSGIILDTDGKTMEALWRVQYRNIFKDFVGKQVVIARPIMDLKRNPITDRKKEVIAKLMMVKHYKKRYPWWRVPLNIIPPLARKLATKKHLVCSELTAKNLWLIGARHDQYPGTTPDQLSDEFHHWKEGYEIIFEGMIK